MRSARAANCNRDKLSIAVQRHPRRQKRARIRPTTSGSLRAMKGPENPDQGLARVGKGRDRVLTCDLTKEYVAINVDDGSLTVLAGAPVHG